MLITVVVCGRDRPSSDPTVADAKFEDPHTDGTPAHIHIHFIFLLRILIGLHFPTNDIGLSSLKFFWRAPEFLFTSARGRFGCSRSSKVDEFGANRKRVCDFLLVRNSTLGPILHRFGAIACFMCS